MISVSYLLGIASFGPSYVSVALVYSPGPGSTVIHALCLLLVELHVAIRLLLLSVCSAF